MTKRSFRMRVDHLVDENPCVASQRQLRLIHPEDAHPSRIRLGPYA